MQTNLALPDEALRLAELARYNTIISEPEDAYSDLARIATMVMNVPFGGVSLVDDHHVWLKGRVGVDISCLAREGAFCSYAVESHRETFVVKNAQADPRFVSNALVTDAPHVRFYAAAPLVGHRGYRLGTLWVMDIKPRELSYIERNTLLALAAQATRLLELSYRNPLTNLPNAHVFVTQVEHILHAEDDPYEHTHATKWMPQQGAVGYIQIKNLHLINSAYGRDTGERVLRELANKLRAWSEKKDLVAHINADSFAFFVSSEPKTLRERLDRLIDMVGKPLPIDAAMIRLSCSVGISHFPQSGTSASALLDQAAAAAVGDQDISSPQVKAFDERDRDLTFQTMQAQALLPMALKEKRITPFYQPQIDILDSGRLAGFEALAQIIDPNLGAISAQHFVPLAENTGLISEVDLQIVEGVCRDLRIWLDRGLEVVPIAVNLSRISLVRRNIVDEICAITKRYSIDPTLIEFEITESGLTDSATSVRERANALNALGFKIGIDDFGTGVSNLSTLHTLTFQRIKADRTYVQGASVNTHVGGIMRFIHNISELVGAELVCEGVEEEKDLDWLKNLGCRYVQGWYFCKSVPFETATRILENTPAFLRTNAAGLSALALFLQTC